MDTIDEYLEIIEIDLDSLNDALKEMSEEDIEDLYEMIDTSFHLGLIDLVNYSRLMNCLNIKR